MQFYIRLVLVVALLLTAGRVSMAAPNLFVAPLGTNGSGDRQWSVTVAPDASLFTNTTAGLGGSLALEVGFEVTGSLFQGAEVNLDDWPYQNTGHNPFTGSITEGVVINGATLFAALGSEVFLSSAPVPVLTLTTQGSGPTTISWGGQSILAGTPNAYLGGRLAQAGLKFDNITGAVSSAVAGDLNGDGAVDALDAGLMFGVWGSADPLGDINMDGFVDAADAGIMFGNWTGDADAAHTSAVPEPASGVVLLAGLVLGAGCRTRHR